MRESDAPISFKEDIEPWLGDQAAFFVIVAGPRRRARAAGPDRHRRRGQGPRGAEKSAEGKLTKHDYKDVEYLTDASEEAGAVFDGLVVLGHGGGLQGGHRHEQRAASSSSDDEAYTKALDDAARTTGSGSST